MRVLILNSPWVNTETEYCVKAGTRWAAVRRKDRSLQYFPFPYFMASTKAYLREAGFDSHFYDAIAEEWSKEECLEKVEALAPDLVVIEAFTPSIYADLEFAQLAKERTGCEVAFCGAHPTALPEEMLSHEQIDYVLLGEYDFPLLDLCEQLKEGTRDFADIGGLAFVDGEGQYQPSQPRRDKYDYDAMPSPAYDELPMLKYTEPLSKFYPTARVVTARGCPHNCSFCIEPLVAGRSYRQRSIPRVMEEIRHLQERFGVREIYFDDAIFTIPRLKKIAKGLIEHEVEVAWTAWVDWRISFEDLKLLRDSGCVGIKFGIESASELIRETVGKGKLVKIEQIQEAVNNCKKLGVLAHGSFLIGGPGETRETLQQTIDLCFDLGLDSSQWSIATPLPGTPFYHQARDEGWLVSDDWSLYDPLTSAVLGYEECEPEDLVAGMAQVRRRKAKQMLSDPRKLASYLWKTFRLMGPRTFARDCYQKARFVAGNLVQGQQGWSQPG
ncbi:MAG: radical SAM protein [Acidobacteriota bacterium]